ncbi:protein FRA10AC1 isoform X3 [Dendrobium catenatum]|uniref:protein FRA10AC1 isoform X3 n=1 Tax=Dendrobium catenatum TaxID=906689 RepID=UPI00109F9ECA|nr:protein FRA10AC1 isoform X3 [Dendrobium catenatum]
MASLGSLKSAVFEREERKMQYQSHIRGLNAYDRHKRFMKDYVQFYGDAKDSDKSFPVKTDHDTIKEGYRFIVSEEDDMESTWEKRLVKRYYDKLFKEYCIADMSQYKKGKIGLRWRTEKEVISGKGAIYGANPKFCQLKSQCFNALASFTSNYFSKKFRQFICGNRHCDEKDGLGSYEVNFSYIEAEENKQALVKLVACKRETCL